MQTLKDGEEALTLDNNSVLVALGKSVNITVALSDSSSAVVSSVKVGDTPLSAGAAGYNTTVSEDVTITVTVVATTTDTYDTSAQGYGNQEKVSGFTTDNGVKFEFSKGDGSNDPAYFDTGTSVRIYAKGTVTITAPEGKSICKIVLESGTGDKSNTITANVGKYDSATKTWTGSANSVTLTVGGTKDHRRIKTYTVTFC